jgi:hypothetical protein
VDAVGAGLVEAMVFGGLGFGGHGLLMIAGSLRLRSRLATVNCPHL